MVTDSADPQTGMTPIQKRILLVVMLGTLMSAIDITIVLLAIPDITKTLSTNLATSIWIILAYLLVVAILTTQLGRVGDIFGRGRMFNFGFVIFTVASVLCGASFNILMLIAFRVLQAVGGALLQANGGAIIADTFERHNRGKAFGYTALGWSLGSMLGVALGGVLTTFLGWPFIFYINLPIGILATYLGFRYIKTPLIRRERIDINGMVILSLILLLITFGATDVASLGVGGTDTAMIIIGLALLPIFLLLEKRSASPTIDLKVFGNRILTNSILAAFFQSLGYLSIAFIVIMYLQGVRGLSPLNAALLLIPGYIVTGITAPRMGRLSDRFGARIIATMGLLLMLGAIIIYLALLNATTPYYVIVIATVISGLGAAMFYPANTSAVMANAESGSYGATSGVLRTMGNIGTLGSFVLTVTATSLAISRSQVFEIFLGTSNLTGNISIAFIYGMHAVFLASIAILLVAIVLSLTRGKEHRHSGQ